jgi:four helix bundle protein
MAGYRDLFFYQKGREVAKGVDQLIKTWSKTMQAQVISQQLFRAATSIGANIAEGHGRHQGREYIHYLTIAQGSANEVDHWLHTAMGCQLGNELEATRLIEVNSEVCRMLNATIRTLGKRRKNQALRESTPPYTLTPFLLEETDL